MKDATTSGSMSGAPAVQPLSDQPQGTGTGVGEQARAGTELAAQATSSIADQAKQKLTGTLEGQRNVAADAVEKLARTVQRSGEQFQGQQDWLASAIGRGAAELNTLAGALRDRDLGELAGEVQSFARRQPAMFMGTALAAGFALARLGKVVAGDLSRDDLPTVPEVGHGQH